MKKTTITFLLVVAIVISVFAGCSSLNNKEKITEDMVVGTWIASKVDYGEDGKYSCLLANASNPWDADEILEVDLNQGGVGKLVYISNSYERTGDAFYDAYSSMQTYYYDCTWRIDGDYLKIESEKCPTYAFSHTDDGKWELTNGDGYISKGELTMDDFFH